MKQQNISENDWCDFIEHFSRDHAGQRVTIELLDPQLGPQKMAQDLPLQGISFDTAGTRPSSLEISAGESPQQHVRHVIDKPMYISVARDDQNREIALQIEPADGAKTLLHLSAQ